MALSYESIKAQIDAYTAQRNQLQQQFHQLNGAISVLQVQLMELSKDLEERKKAEQEKAAHNCEEMKLNESKLQE